jgi:hypothetical protein
VVPHKVPLAELMGVLDGGGLGVHVRGSGVLR